MQAHTNKVQLEARPDSFGYWKVVRVSDGEAIMTALSQRHAERWADEHNARLASGL